MSKSVSFDVLGTCFGFDKAIHAIQDRMGERLAKINVDPKSLFFAWFFAAQRDFTYASLVERYMPIAQILRNTFKRACFVVDLPQEQAPTDDDEAAIMSAVTALAPRPGLKKCLDGLRDAGWDVYGVTNGGKQTSLKYYELAEIALDGDHLLSCDEIQIAKPDSRVYENVNRHLSARQQSGERWFVAAHAWDLAAAKKAGFKTAYLDFEEHDPATAVFGEFDLYASGMEKLLEKMVAL